MKKVLLAVAFSLLVVLTLASCNKHTCTPGEIKTYVWYEATCTKEGLMEESVYCVDCGKTISRVDKVIPVVPCQAGDRTEKDYSTYVQATCLKDGHYNEIKYCTWCDKIASRDTVVIPKLTDHIYETYTIDISAPNCVSEGEYYLITYCSYCNIEIGRETKISPITEEHTPKEAVIENRIGSDCTSAGSYDEVVYCLYCNYEISRKNKEVAILGHTPSDAVVENEIESTCTVNGNYDSVIYCTVCDAELSRENNVSPLIPHAIVSATCSVCKQVVGNIGLKYSLDSSSASYVVSKGDCSDTNIIIPSKHNGLPVTVIHGFNNAVNIQSIELPETITSIGNYTFENCTGLTSIVIPDGVTSIGYKTFNGCTSLANISLGGNISEIGEYAFYDCKALKEISLNNVTTINANAFYGCVSLENVHIGSKLKTIGNNAFYNCSSLKEITIPNSAASIGTNILYGCNSLHSISTTIYKDYLGYLFGAPSYEKQGEYIPSSLKNVVITKGKQIKYSAFYNCQHLIKVVLPDTIETIDGHSFAGCVSLQSITIPFVGENLEGSGNTNLGHLFGSWSTYPHADNSNVPKTLREVIITGGNKIGRDAFYDCDMILSITIPESVTNIDQYAFWGCYRLFEVINKSSLTLKGNHSKEEGYLSTSIIHNENSKIINNDVFLFSTYNGINYLLGYCGNESNITLPDRYCDEIYDIYDYAFIYCDFISNIEIPDGVRRIGGCAFSNCSSLTNINIPKSVTNIGSDAFYNCSALTNITIPNSVTSISRGTFDGCSSLENFEIHNNVNSIGDYAFRGCSKLTNIYVPSSVQTIGYGAFEGCSSLESITLPFVGQNNQLKSEGSYLTHFGIIFGYTFSNDYIDGWHACEETRQPYSITGYYKYNIPESLKSVTILEGITSINPWAFRNCVGLESINVPNGITKIGEYAFACCEFDSFIIPDTVTEVHGRAFLGCLHTKIVIPKSLTYIQESAFERWIYITDIYFTGTEKEWEELVLDEHSLSSISRATIYYFSENEPTEGVNYWHYVDGVATPWTAFVSEE